MSGPSALELSNRFVLLGREAGAPQEFHETMALSIGGDGLELGGESIDAAMDGVLGLHRLVGGQACAAVVEHAEEHGAGRDVVGLGCRVGVVGLVEGDVGDVRLPAASSWTRRGSPWSSTV